MAGLALVSIRANGERSVHGWPGEPADGIGPAGEGRGGEDVGQSSDGPVTGRRSQADTGRWRRREGR
jgi:hypothetical protein